SVVDFGCGDWQFSQLIDWSATQYLGCDIVPSVVAENRRRFERPNVKFVELSGDHVDLPTADLLIVKDVLQHWSNDAVLGFVPTLKRYRHVLVTNCVHPLGGETVNTDIPDGGFRPL